MYEATASCIVYRIPSLRPCFPALRSVKVTGDVVNLAARIEKMTKQYDAQVLVSEAVWDALDAALPLAEALGTVTVRGREEPVRLYRLA